MINLSIVFLHASNQFHSPMLHAASFSNSQMFSIHRSTFQKFYFSSFFSSSLLLKFHCHSTNFNDFLSSAVVLRSEDYQNKKFIRTLLFNHTDSSHSFTDCAFRRCTSDEAGGGLFCASEELTIKSCSFVHCTARYSGGFLFMGERATITQICAMSCYASEQNHVFSSVANSTTFTDSHIDSCTYMKRSGGSTTHLIGGNSIGESYVSNTNASRNFVSDSRAAGGFRYLAKLDYVHNIAINNTGRVIVGFSSPNLGFYKITESCFSGSKYLLTSRQGYLFEFEGNVTIFKSTFIKNSKRFYLACMRNADQRPDSSITFIDCEFDSDVNTIDKQEKISTKDVKYNIEKLTIPQFQNVSFAEWKCKTDPIPLPTESPSESLPAPTKTPTKTALPPPSTIACTAAKAAAAAFYEEQQHEMGIGEMLQIGGLVFLIVVVITVFAVANKAKEKKLRAAKENEERKAFLIQERV